MVALAVWLVATAMMVLTFFIFFPYFGIRCLGEVMGEPGSKHS